MVPNYRILFNDVDRTETLRPFFSKAMVSDRDGTELDTASIHLTYSSEIEIPDRGAKIEIDFGYEGSDLFKVFKGIINNTGISGYPETLVLSATGLALSDDERLQGSQVRTYNDMSLGAIAQDIISTAGFNARIHEKLSDIEVKRLMQTSETDLEILQRLSKEFGGFLKSDGETIAVLPQRSEETVTGAKLPPVRIEKETTPISEYGWSINQRQFKGTVIAFYIEDGDGKTQFVQKGSGTPEVRLKTIYASKAEANAAATNETEKYKESQTFSASMPGQDISVGAPLEIEKFPDPVNGDYWVRQVEHTLDDTFTTRIEATR